MYFSKIFCLAFIFSCTIESITFINKTGEKGSIWLGNSKEKQRPRHIKRPISLDNYQEKKVELPRTDSSATESSDEDENSPDFFSFSSDSGTKFSPRIFIKNLEDYNVITLLPKETFYKEEEAKISNVKESIPQLPQGVTNIIKGYCSELHEEADKKIDYTITIDEEAKKEAIENYRRKIGTLERQLAHYKEKLQRAESKS